MTITYHDVSHFQGAYKPTGPTCAKATEGSTFTDPEFAGIRRRTRAGGWSFLAYHFLAHGNISAQVQHVIAVVGHEQPIMLDVESEAGQSDPTLTDVLNFADAYAHAGGLVSLCYLPHWYWSDHLHSPSLRGLSARHIGLVSSNYTRYSPNGPGWAPYGGVTPIVWQYTDTPLDTNAYKGTQTGLTHLWNHGTRPIPKPQPEPEDPDMPYTLDQIAHACAAYKNPNDPKDVDMHQHAVDATAALAQAQENARAIAALALEVDSLKTLLTEPTA